MNIWEDVYNKNKGIGRVPVYPQQDQNHFLDQQPTLSPDHKRYQPMPEDTCSPEDVYCRNNTTRQPSSKNIPNQEMKQAHAITQGFPVQSQNFIGQTVNTLSQNPFPYP